MKTSLRMTMMTSLLLFSAACSADGSEQFSFKDEALETVVSEHLDSEETSFNEEELASIQSLDGYESNITNIDGIETLTNVERVNLSGNDIDDLSPLLSLEHLEEVHVGDIYFTGDFDDANFEVIEQLEEMDVDVEARSRLSFDEHEGPSEGVFYQIEENDQTVYLLGSIHVGDDTLYPLHDEIDSAFEGADSLAVEVDITDIDELEASQVMMQHGMYMDGTSLSDVLGEEIFDETVEYLSEFGVGAPMLEQFKPWFISQLISEMALEESSYSGEDGIDLYFLERANEQNLPIISLESVESQFEAISSAPEEQQVESLEAMLNDIDIFEDEIEQMMRLWQSGNVDVFTQLREFDQEHEQVLLDDRDLAMAEKIEEFLQDDDGETYFVVVGALHLVGEDSIIGLLDERGYEIKAPISE